jgi:hypothetical protein
MSATFNYMPKQWITFLWEYGYRHANVPYWTGRGGITPPGGNTGGTGVFGGENSGGGALVPGTTFVPGPTLSATLPATPAWQDRTAGARTFGGMNKVSGWPSWSCSRFLASIVHEAEEEHAAAAAVQERSRTPALLRRPLLLRLERALKEYELTMRVEFFMKRKAVRIGLLFSSVFTLLFIAACSRAQGDTAAEAPPPANVVAGADVNLFTVDHPEQFPVAAAIARATAP